MLVSRVYDPPEGSSDVVVMKIELFSELELVVEMNHVNVTLPLHGGLIQK